MFEVIDSSNDIERLSNTIAMLSIDAVENANSGHPGLPMGASFFSSLLWSRFLNFNPEDPRWLGRDRFILSAGHGSMLLYSLLHLFKYDVSLEDIKAFRKWGSNTPGHPEFGHTDGVEATTGPLGQGAANAVGMALAGKMLAAEYDKDLFNYNVYALVSDGDLMEGVAAEACSLAGHLGLGNLIFLYDDNKISLAGGTDVCFTESVEKRFQGYGWHTQSVDGYELASLNAGLTAAVNESARPSILCIQSIIGKGSPNKQNSSSAHGSPLGADEVQRVRKAFGWPEQQFYIPEKTTLFCSEVVETRKTRYDGWMKRFAEWQTENPEKADRLSAQMKGEVSADLEKLLLTRPSQKKPAATRALSSEVLQLLGQHVPGIVGGSADLESSTKTTLEGHGEVQGPLFEGRNIRYGVREHAMGAIANGFAYEGCWKPFVSTFLVFSDYLRPSIRLAALSKLQVLYVFTHDSVWVGEDGPTHEPVEHVQSLRLIPGLDVYRPADDAETAACYLSALKRKDRPAALVFTRQNTDIIDREDSWKAESVLKGGYVVKEQELADVSLVATGSEVGCAQEAASLLAEQGIKARVVSIPCVEIFLEQDESYRSTVIPRTIPSVSVEAGVTTGWRDLLGPCAMTIGIDRYGASAPGAEVIEKLGLDPKSVSERVFTFLDNLKG